MTVDHFEEASFRDMYFAEPPEVRRQNRDKARALNESVTQAFQDIGIDKTIDNNEVTRTMDNDIITTKNDDVT